MGILVDGSVVIKSIQFADWVALCGDLLSVAPETIYGGRIEMNWIRKYFAGLDEDLTERSKQTQLGVCHASNIVLRDVSKVIPDELFVNPNAWHVKNPLVVYAIVEMHETNRVLRKLGFRQVIPVAPQDLDDLHPINLRQPYENWSHAIRSTCHGLGFIASHICTGKRSIISAHARIIIDDLNNDAYTTPIQYVLSYSNAYSNPIISTQALYVAPYFSASNPMSSWTLEHPSPMFYMLVPSTFPMTPTSMTMYRPS
ncbi:hypothetical protein Godav_024499 [Gossypium davidsonii]|uniref:Uncharacterized protein n=1 Tax=Gossypium davidsonii TaxID=34287 RepID=A0A7J8T7J6_GOSDV|nr:hypothetical protein [Gossypium davidsonii]